MKIIKSKCNKFVKFGEYDTPKKKVTKALKNLNNIAQKAMHSWSIICTLDTNRCQSMYDDNAHFEEQIVNNMSFFLSLGLSLFAFMWMTPRKDSAFRLRHLALSFLFAIYISFAQKKELSNIYKSFAYIATLWYASQLTVTLQVTVWQNRVSNSLLKMW